MTRHPFDLLMERADSFIRIAEANLLFAADHEPGLESDPWLKQLDSLAKRVERVAGRSSEERIAAIKTVLVDEEGLTGSREDYYDPRNSFIHQVLQRRVGLPICLSAIWLDISEQLGWPLYGIGLPGQFIVGCSTGHRVLLVDPYHDGRSLTREGCEFLVSRMAGEPVSLDDAMFQPAGKREILTRMLTNLQSVYTQKRAWHDASCVLCRLLAIHPHSEELRIQLGQVNTRLAERN